MIKMKACSYRREGVEGKTPRPPGGEKYRVVKHSKEPYEGNWVFVVREHEVC